MKQLSIFFAAAVVHLFAQSALAQTDQAPTAREQAKIAIAKEAREAAQFPIARPWDKDAAGRRPWEPGYVAPEKPTDLVK